MSNTPNMANLFEKLNDLKTLFQYGERLVPIIKSLVDFMQDTVPLLENINHSIADSTSKIPAASNQIHNVTNATEMATTEILDLIDVISNDLSVIEKINTENFSKTKDKFEALEALKKHLKGDKKGIEIIDKLKSLLFTSNDIESIEGKLKKIKDNTYQITLSLQVQDITAQQLAAVNHLIDSVQERLSSLIQDIDNNNIAELSSIRIKVPEGAAFDPNASYSKSQEKQNIADDIINTNSKTSQDEIDKLFS